MNFSSDGFLSNGIINSVGELLVTWSDVVVASLEIESRFGLNDIQFVMFSVFTALEVITVGRFGNMEADSFEVFPICLKQIYCPNDRKMVIIL